MEPTLTNPSRVPMVKRAFDPDSLFSLQGLRPQVIFLAGHCDLCDLHGRCKQCPPEWAHS